MKLTGGYSIQDRIYYGRLFIGSKNKLVQRIIPMKIREIELINPLESASPENCNKSFGTIVNGKLAASAMSTGFLVEFVFFLVTRAQLIGLLGTYQCHLPTPH